MGIGLVPSNNSPVIFTRSYRINDDSVSVGPVRGISLTALETLMYSTCPPTSTPIRRFFPVVIVAVDTSKMKASSDRIGVGWSRCVQNPSDKISIGGAKVRDSDVRARSRPPSYFIAHPYPTFGVTSYSNSLPRHQQLAHW